jgi:protein-tyrosine phosphatase
MESNNLKSADLFLEKGFSPAFPLEVIVYGARRPGFFLEYVSVEIVNSWIHFMQSNRIERVLILLSENEVKMYDDLINQYRNAFQNDNISWVPIQDFSIIDSKIMLSPILQFLKESNDLNKKVVVHCSGGIGRTGQVLAAWLVCYRNFTHQEALNALQIVGRCPNEGKNREDIFNNISICRNIIEKT